MAGTASELNIARVNALPVTPAANTMYFVKGGEAGLMDVYVTGSTGAEIRHIISKAEINSMMANAVGAFSNILVVGDIATRDALVPDLGRNVVVMVGDATGDATVKTGAATYLFDAASLNWTKLSEFAELDLVLQWDAIQGRPTSTVAQIDAAVAAAHTHANMAVLDKLSQDTNGIVMYNNKYIKPVIEGAEW